MKNSLYISALATLLFLAGCSNPAKPLDSGAVVSGTVWAIPPRSVPTGNSSTDIPKDAQVDVYHDLIIIHLADGSRQLVPMDYVSNLKIK
jgi:hypothetical protein